ncbi:MAG TPA: hypothetical protein DDX99_12090 [Desulfofustis sp.]|nr:hypothetical protein [Desulfofustis sp.]
MITFSLSMVQLVARSSHDLSLFVRHKSAHKIFFNNKGFYWDDTKLQIFYDSGKSLTVNKRNRRPGFLVKV